MSNPVFLRRRAAAEYLRNMWGVPCSEKTLAKLACVGGGPVFRRFGRVPLYTETDLDAYAEAKLSKPVQSTSELAPRAGSPALRNSRPAKGEPHLGGERACSSDRADV